MDDVHQGEKDHPRVCGEKTARVWVVREPQGSPPRVRGKVADMICTLCVLRITPACAGKSFSAASETRADWDHPRVCGERGRTKTMYDAVEDHPRVCGEKCSVGILRIRERRITPACAGKSAVRPWQIDRPWDHPRVRGEKSICSCIFVQKLGSPPRARGKGVALVLTPSASGITPACAGKRARIQRRAAHMARITPACAGRRLAGDLLRHLDAGITPACAGKRSRSRRAKRPMRDHPRVRGEKTAVCPVSFSHLRITPACAGKRPARRRPTSPARDHPRVRGEKILPNKEAMELWG